MVIKLKFCQRKGLQGVCSRAFEIRNRKARIWDLNYLYFTFSNEG
jgi:hypothetical protein